MTQHSCASGMCVDLDTQQLLILYFLFNPLNRAEMLLSIRLVLDLKIWLIYSLQWATQENNTVPGGPGYPDRRERSL